MTRLFRPHIPLEVRIKVAERQRASPAFYQTVDWTGLEGRRLKYLLKVLAAQFACTVKELHLDHDPPLGARKRRGEGKKTIYDPPANSPAHLAYRPHGVQFEGSHDVKTRIRGDHGQF